MSRVEDVIGFLSGIGVVFDERQSGERVGISFQSQKKWMCMRERKSRGNGTVCDCFWKDIGNERDLENLNDLWIDEELKKCRKTELPGCGAHFPAKKFGLNGTKSNQEVFFEGWYYRITSPEIGSFAFMYSEPAIDENEPLHDHKMSMMQVLLPSDKLLLESLPDSRSKRWNQLNSLNIGHWNRLHRIQSTEFNGNARQLPSRSFFERVQSGFQLNLSSHDGVLFDERNQHSMRWNLDWNAVLYWGSRGRNRSRQTASVLSILPLFETGYQVISALGIANGSIEYTETSSQGELMKRQVHLKNAKVYVEKNWGNWFPEKWFWLQCHDFESHFDASLTCVGVVRQVAGQPEVVGLMAMHINGEFLEIANWNGRMQWSVEQWGSWKIDGYAADNATLGQFRMRVHAICDEPSVGVLGPSPRGMRATVRDSSKGKVNVFVERNNQTVCSLYSNLCAVEVGGTPWPSTWNENVQQLPKPLSNTVNFFHGH